MSKTNRQHAGFSDTGLHSAGKLIDKSDSHMKSVTSSGSNVKKQVPGMNNSIVPLVAPK